MVRFFTLFIIFLLSPSQISFAEENQTFQEPNLGWQFFKLIFFLFLILAMIYFLFRFLSRKNGLVRSNAFQLLGGIPLGQNKSIQFVEIGQKIYVLGIGQDVHLLQIIDNQEELQQIRDLVSAPSIANDRLIGWLNHIKSVFSPLKRFMEKKNLEKIHSIKSFEELLNRKMADLKEQRTQSLKEIIHTKSDTSTEKLGKRDSDE